MLNNCPNIQDQTNNSNLVATLIHDTDRMSSLSIQVLKQSYLNGNDILLNQKKSLFLFGYLLNCCTFAVLQIIIYYGQGIFYALKASILKIYREVVSVCHSLWRMIVCSKIGYDFSFSFTNK